MFKNGIEPNVNNTDENRKGRVHQAKYTIT
jgi:hypothetical protein